MIKTVLTKKALQIFIFESIGTFLLAYGVGCSAFIVPLNHGSDFFISCSLFIALTMAGQITEGHFNPIISIAAYVKKKFDYMPIYILSHFTGSILGVLLFFSIKGKSVIPISHESVSEPLEYVKYFMNETAGSFLFSICVLTLTNRLTTHTMKAWQTYLSIPVALYLVRLMTAGTSLNIAVGVCYQILATINQGDWGLLEYTWLMIVPSILGAILGGLTMKYLYQPLLLSIRFKEEITQSALSE